MSAQITFPPSENLTMPQRLRVMAAVGAPVVLSSDDTRAAARLLEDGAEARAAVNDAMLELVAAREALAVSEKSRRDAEVRARISFWVSVIIGVTAGGLIGVFSGSVL